MVKQLSGEAWYGEPKLGKFMVWICIPSDG